MIEKKITTDLNEDEFYIRLNKNERVGLITTESNNNYLILDSYDYWYDIIQENYPSELKCKCKNNKFKLQFNYYKRNNSDDFYKIDIITICSICMNQKLQMKIDIDYSPTHQLLNNPIIYCKEPKLKYDFTEITSFWNKNDVISFIEYMFHLGFINTAWYWKNNSRYLKSLSIEQTTDLVKSGKYLSFSFSLHDHNYLTTKDEKGLYMKNDQWRKGEIVQLKSPTTMYYEKNKKGYLYYINFCNQYIDNFEIKSKSMNFKSITEKINNYLKTSFINVRGKNSYDNKEEILRLFSNKYIVK